MSETTKAKSDDPEDLELRAKPHPVARINRKVLILLSGTGLLLIFGATIFALDPPKLFSRNETSRELYQTRNTPKPEGLDALPRRYSDLAKTAEPELKPKIKLGPPLPGDIGPVILNTERELGLSPPSAAPFRPNPEVDAARAERIRQARIAQQARESKVFFQLASNNADAASSPASTPPTGRTARRNPFAVTPAPAASPNSANPFAFDLENDQNLQGRKIGFLDQKIDKSTQNSHALQKPASPYQVLAGTIIPASLVTGINSDLPGRVIAQVTEHVYDTVSGRHLLIPQGSRIIGKYDSVVAFGQSRALVVWQRIIRPDGSSITIENLPATDTAGYAGLEDKVNFHTWRLVKGIVLSTLLGVGTELSFGNNESDLVRALRDSAQDSTSKAGQKITERNLNIQPTITVRPGWPLRIIVNKDLTLQPYKLAGASP